MIRLLTGLFFILLGTNAFAQQNNEFTPERRKALEEFAAEKHKGSVIFDRTSSQGKIVNCVLNFGATYRDESVPGPFKLLLVKGYVISYPPTKGPANFQIVINLKIVEMRSSENMKDVPTDVHYVGLAIGNAQIEQFREIGEMREEGRYYAYYFDDVDGEMVSLSLENLRKGPTILMQATPRLFDHRIELIKLEGGVEAVRSFHDCFSELYSKKMP